MRKGSKITEEHREKLRKAHKGKKLSIVHREKISESNRGREVSEITRQKISIQRRGVKNPMWKGGRPKCLDCGKEIEWTSKRCDNCNKKSMSGENSPAWKGGVTPIKMKIRKSQEYRRWRDAVFSRDNYSCQICGIKGGKLNADHIVPFSLLIQKIIDVNEKVVYEEISEYSSLWDISNGRTLCVPCHKNTETFAARAKKFKKIEDVQLVNILDGKWRANAP